MTGFIKKVEALAKEKECQVLSPWIRSISNHMYWSAASSEPNQADIIEAKWKSLGNHIQDKHDGHGETFPKCSHDIVAVPTKKYLQPSMYTNTMINISNRNIIIKQHIKNTLFITF